MNEFNVHRMCIYAVMVTLYYMRSGLLVKNRFLFMRGCMYIIPISCMHGRILCPQHYKASFFILGYIPIPFFGRPNAKCLPCAAIAKQTRCFCVCKNVLPVHIFSCSSELGCPRGWQAPQGYEPSRRAWCDYVVRGY